MIVSLLRKWRATQSLPAIVPVTRNIKNNVQTLVEENGLIPFQKADFHSDNRPLDHLVSSTHQFRQTSIDVRGPEVVYFWDKLKKCFGSKKSDKKKGDKKAKKQSCKKKKCSKQKDTCLKKKESCEKPSEKKELCKTGDEKKVQKKDDPCKKKEEKKAEPCKKNEEKKGDGDKKKDPCKKNEEKKVDMSKKSDPCKKKEEKKEDPCKKKEDPCKKKEDPCKKKEDPCKKKEDPCKKKEDPCKKKEDPCKKKEEKKDDPCKKKEDPCKKKEDPCKKKEEKKDDPCKKKEDPCKKKEEKKDDPCKKKEDPCKKKEDPCKKKEDPCKKKEEKKEDPCKKKEDPCKKKEDPCKKKEEKKEDPCKKKEDPCKKKEDPCKKKEDPCKKKEDPCKKKEDPCKKKEEKKEDPCEPCKEKEDPCKKKDPCAKFVPDVPLFQEPFVFFARSNATSKKEEDKCSKPCRNPCAEGACDVLPGQDEPCNAAASWKIKVRPCRKPSPTVRGGSPPSGPCFIDKIVVEEKLEPDSKCGITSHPCGKKACPNKCEVKPKTKFSEPEGLPEGIVSNILSIPSYHALDFQSAHTLNFANARGPVPPRTGPMPPRTVPDSKNPGAGRGVPGTQPPPAAPNYSEKVAGFLEKIRGLWQGSASNPEKGNQQMNSDKAKQQPKTTGKRLFGMLDSEDAITEGGCDQNVSISVSLESLSAEGDSHILFVTDDFEKCEDRVPPCPLEPPSLPCPAEAEGCVKTTNDIWSDIDANWGYEKFPWKSNTVKDERLEEVSLTPDDPYANNKL